MVNKSRIGYSFSTNEVHSFSSFNCLKNVENETKYFIASIDDAQKAVEIAHAAFFVYKNSEGRSRANFLNQIALKLEINRNRLIKLFCAESSLSDKRASLELDRTILQLNEFSKLIENDSWREEIKYTNEKTQVQIVSKYEALGPVVVFGASNFPFAYSTIGGDSAAALAVGCPVIVKAHPMHVGTSCAVAELILETAKELDLPNGIFSHLIDDGFEVGRVLVEHPMTRAVGFTGSIKGGRSLMDMASKRSAPIPVFAEMGSLNPVIFRDSEFVLRMDYWVNSFAMSISNDAGQFCTKPGLLFVPNSELGQLFVRNLAQKLGTIEPKCHLHPTLYASYKKLVESEFEWTETQIPYHSQPTLRVVSSLEFKKNDRLKEEYFGPQSIAVMYNDDHELLNNLTFLEGQLTATVIAERNDLNQLQSILEELKYRAGRIIFNGVPTGVTVTEAMVHGGSYPASSDSRFSAVGLKSIRRFIRPISFQEISEI